MVHTLQALGDIARQRVQRYGDPLPPASPPTACDYGDPASPLLQPRRIAAMKTWRRAGRNGALLDITGGGDDITSRGDTITW